ncbi:MAG: TAT-variant-translocated molybdopterin oxidoreductase [Opitutaceae bacterium]|nr:TAT-variant-translocated molybdopterin oxidoreductase [Opitutaceae bacterium]
MKRQVQHPAPSERELNGPRYWRSLDELAATPGFRAYLEREFPEGAARLDGVDRRQFFKLMAASFALGGIGLAGCRRPEAYVLPYGKSVEEVKPGLPLYFATALPLRRAAIPLVAETYQGRPTKLEGNPSYAPHGGASSLLAQASLLDLYDPDRATTHLQNGAAFSAAALNDLLAAIGNKYAAGRGAGLAFLAESSSSPTRAALVARLQERFPGAVWAEYEPVVDEPPVEAARLAFGRDVKPVHRFAQARRIVSLDGDFLQAGPAALADARSFARGRRVTSPDEAARMNRLYVAESGLTITGAMADHRLRIASSHVPALAAALAGRVLGTDAYAAPAAGLDVKPEWIAECAADLLAHRGESLVVAGAHQPVAVHALAHLMNAALGNIGRTVDFVAAEPSGASTIQQLAAAIKAGSVKTLFILGGNPVYNAPADLDWTALQTSVPEVIRYGAYVDETSAPAGVHVAATHYLESWGDARTADGTIVPVQPMILPLFDGMNELTLLARVLGDAVTDPYTLVSNTITRLTGGDPEKVFRRFLYDGLLEGTAYPPVGDLPARADAATAILAAAPRKPEVGAQALEVRFVADYKTDDGRFANNGWLQECPDPITRLTWDNAILISPRLAGELNILPPLRGVLPVARDEAADWVNGREQAHIGVVQLGGRTVRGPLQIQPGLSNYTIILPLGYGRTQSGRVGTGAGFNAYALRTGGTMHVATGATIEIVPGERYVLANTQEHWSMEGRDLIREANVDEFKANPAFAAALGLEAHSPPYDEASAARPLEEKVTEIPRGNSLYTTPKFDGLHQWGMSIDLNTCIGCQACVVACQAENNIPIVGKEQVARGREMHWIRIDRYYSDGRIAPGAFGGAGNREIPEDPQVSLEPMACQQCELAPCEMVCPVNATVHDNEGLNVMAYNRCVGTRYCANNCPYKVRRFNYFDWNKHATDALYLGPVGRQQEMPELLKMVRNPEVTVRMRGVMEKCTYCVQRIENAKIRQKVKAAQAGHPGDVIVRDGAVRTACQQACPVEAIVFGNLLDPASAVRKTKAQPRDYAVLGYLNVRPRTTYLGKLRNPNPRMPDYAGLPLSRREANLKNPAPAHAAGESGDGKQETGGHQ